MADPLVTLLAAVGTGGGLFYGAQKFFKTIEDNLTAESKAAVAGQLIDVRLAPRAKRISVNLSTLLDAFFGPSHWTWRCFIRSAICSMALFIVIIATVLPIIVFDLWTAGKMSETTVLELLFASELTFFIVLPFVNILPDYFSLWKARILVRASTKTDRTRSKLIYFAVDLFVSGLIACIPTLLLTSIMLTQAMVFFTNTEPSLMDYVRDIPDAAGEMGIGLLLLNFPAAALASLWVVLYFCGRSLASFAMSFDSVYSWYISKFDIRSKPLQCIGLLSGALLAVVYWVGVGVFILI